ncbi:MAG: PorT family protein [Paludibacteraceae bacterium]|nr:PorT family protein [Paludibacteraceae bacterium]
MKRLYFSILLLLILVSVPIKAQHAHGQVNNLVSVDNKLYHFGFILGLNMMDFNPSHSAVVDADGKIWFGEDTRLMPGFSVGIISDLRIFSWLNLRFTPVLLFNQRNLTFRDADGVECEDGMINVQSNIMEFPLSFKIRAQRKHNYRPYLLAGAAMTVDMGRDSENAIMLKQVDYGVEVGVGIDFYLPYFKLCPELKFYFGLGDVLERERPEIADITDMKYTHALSKLTSRLIVLSFNFE